MHEIRQCYTCGKIMHYRNFILGAHNKVQREHFTYEMVPEIWDNPIFVIKCCDCFYGKNHAIAEIERIGNLIKLGREIREAMIRKKKRIELISW